MNCYLSWTFIGVTFIIHGPPSCGKTTLSIALARHYKIPILTIDDIIMDAVQSPKERIHHRVLNYIHNPVSSSQPSSYGPGTARSVQTPPEQDRKSRDKSNKVSPIKISAKPVKPPPHQKGAGPPGGLKDPNAQKDKLDPELAFQTKKFTYVNYLTDEQVLLQSGFIIIYESDTYGTIETKSNKCVLIFYTKKAVNEQFDSLTGERSVTMYSEDSQNESTDTRTQIMV